MREEIRAIQQRLKLTVAYVTHDQSEALTVSDQIIVMDHAVIAQRGSPEALYGHPESEFVAGFMGEATVFAAQVAPDGEVRLGPLQLPARPGVAADPVKAAVRPEAWRIGTAAQTAGLPATLRKATYLGSAYEYVFDTPLGAIRVVSSDLSRPLRAGEAGWLTLAEHGVSVVPSTPLSGL